MGIAVSQENEKATLHTVSIIQFHWFPRRQNLNLMNEVKEFQIRKVNCAYLFLLTQQLPIIDIAVIGD